MLDVSLADPSEAADGSAAISVSTVLESGSPGGDEAGPAGEEGASSDS